MQNITELCGDYAEKGLASKIWSTGQTRNDRLSKKQPFQLFVKQWFYE